MQPFGIGMLVTDRTGGVRVRELAPANVPPSKSPATAGLRNGGYGWNRTTDLGIMSLAL